MIIFLHILVAVTYKTMIVFWPLAFETESLKYENNRILGYFIQQFYYSDQSKLFLSNFFFRFFYKKSVLNFRHFELLDFLKKKKRENKGNFLLFD